MSKALFAIIQIKHIQDIQFKLIHPICQNIKKPNVKNLRKKKKKQHTRDFIADEHP